MDNSNSNPPKQHISKEAIAAFLSGSNPMERVVKIEADYKSAYVKVFYRDTEGVKRCTSQPLFPFVWAKQSACRALYGGDRNRIKAELDRYGITCKGLQIAPENGAAPLRMEAGFRVLFQSRIPMSFSKFQEFFENGGRPIYGKGNNDDPNRPREYISVSPNEQFMIQTGIRLFKGFDDYDDLVRVTWDIETTGLTPQTDVVDQVGIRSNRGFEKVIEVEGEGEEKKANETKALEETFQTFKELDPDIIAGHNTENFDWNFFDVRLQVKGTTLADFTKSILGFGVYKKKKDQVLKLGGEMEYFKPTVYYGVNLTDSLFAVRRAMAINSNMKSANLKYVCQYSGIKKDNRVYVPGKYISTIWREKREIYAFCDKDGDWFKVDDKTFTRTYKEKVLKPESEWETDMDGNTVKTYDEVEHIHYTKTEDGLVNNQTGNHYQMVSGRYIVKRYLLDDLYEGDKVELRYNTTNFLVCKMLPVSFEKACTMGTAAIWKYIMLAWSYEHGLAVPDLVNTYKFTGGLSRLLRVGFVDRIVKLDYNSLYPSIILSYAIESDVDIAGAMNSLLEYILTQREYFKDMKKKAGKEAERLAEEIKKCPDEAEKARLEEKRFRAAADYKKYDGMQSQLKVLANSFFGSFGSGTPFPWSVIPCAEQTTATGRMCLRLMIGHFTKLGYTPIVGDSFTPDTPLFIKYDDTNFIDIKPISALVNEKSIEVDALGREYDYSDKPYQVLCRNGWMKPHYIYRHATDKSIYRVQDKEHDMVVDVTEDHSLFNADHQKITPKEIDEQTKLEYHNGPFGNAQSDITVDEAVIAAVETTDSVPVAVLNASKEVMSAYYYTFRRSYVGPKTKTLAAGINYIKNCIGR